MRMAWRLQHNPKMAERYQGLTYKTERNEVNWTGNINIVRQIMHQPLQVKTPTLWFVNSMSDLFHASIFFSTIDEIYNVMEACPQHTFQILTKRPERMLEYYNWKREGNGLKFGRWPLTNVWIGTSIETQETANGRLKTLLTIPAMVRFVSAEPLLGRVNLGQALAAEVTDMVKWALRQQLHWVIVGGESGPDARPMHPDWARDLRDECVDLGIPFFFKQWGEWEPFEYMDPHGKRFTHLTPSGKNEILMKADPAANFFMYNDLNMRRVGKKAAGRMLDGREWDEMPVQ